MGSPTKKSVSKDSISNGFLKNNNEKEAKKLLQRDESIHEDARDEEEFVPPDGGWGWVVCFASFWTNGTAFGILNTFGILYVKLLQEFGGEGNDDVAFKTSWIGALQISMTFFMSPFASILVDRFGIRQTAFAGAILATIGMVASSFVKQLELMYFTYGILLGLGTSLIYNPSLVILGHYFRKRLGIVNGIVSFGSAVFTIVLPFVMKEMLASVGLRHTMRFLAALLAVQVFCAFSWKPLFQNRHTELDHYFSTEKLGNKCSGCLQFLRRFLNVKIWGVRGYRVWALAVPVGFLGYFIPFVHLVQHTKDVLPEVNGGVLVMCIGATTGVSRLVVGKIADLPQINRIHMQQFAFLVLGIATACIPFAKNFPGLIAITLVMGLADGCFICLIGPIAFDLLGPAGAAQGIGCLLGICSFPMTAGPPLAGLAYDYLGSYQIVFHAAGAPPIIAALLLFLIPRKRQAKAAVSMTATMAAMSLENLDMVGRDDTGYFHSLVWDDRYGAGNMVTNQKLTESLPHVRFLDHIYTPHSSPAQVRRAQSVPSVAPQLDPVSKVKVMAGVQNTAVMKNTAVVANGYKSFPPMNGAIANGQILPHPGRIPVHKDSLPEEIENSDTESAEAETNKQRFVLSDCSQDRVIDCLSVV